MVCLGNICRSPLAHGILQQEILSRNLAWEVDSAGTSSWHNGEQPDSRSIEVALKHDIDIRTQSSRQFQKSDFTDFDLIIAMDNQNYKDIISLSSDAGEKSKVKILLNYSYPNENRAVPDPYYSGGFDYVYTLIKEAVDNLLKQELN